MVGEDMFFMGEDTMGEDMPCMGEDETGKNGPWFAAATGEGWAWTKKERGVSL
jgi:hypothetical protein